MLNAEFFDSTDRMEQLNNEATRSPGACRAPEWSEAGSVVT